MTIDFIFYWLLYSLVIILLWFQAIPHQKWTEYAHNSFDHGINQPCNSNPILDSPYIILNIHSILLYTLFGFALQSYSWLNASTWSWNWIMTFMMAHPLGFVLQKHGIDMQDDDRLLILLSIIGWICIHCMMYMIVWCVM